MSSPDTGPDHRYPRRMTTTRRYILSISLAGGIFFGSIPLWDRGVEVVMLAILLAALAYEAVWWGRVNNDRSEKERRT